MELKIIENKRNNLLKRQEIIAETYEKSTPSKEKIREKLSAMLNLPKERIVVTKAMQEFGSKKTKIFARVYDDEKQLEKIEPEHIKKRNFKTENKEK